ATDSFGVDLGTRVQRGSPNRGERSNSSATREHHQSRGADSGSAHAFPEWLGGTAIGAGLLPCRTVFAARRARRRTAAVRDGMGHGKLASRKRRKSSSLEKGFGHAEGPLAPRCGKKHGRSYRKGLESVAQNVDEAPRQTRARSQAQLGFFSRTRKKHARIPRKGPTVPKSENCTDAGLSQDCPCVQ